jgi:hypothetical protein
MLINRFRIYIITLFMSVCLVAVSHDFSYMSTPLSAVLQASPPARSQIIALEPV